VNADQERDAYRMDSIKGTLRNTLRMAECPGMTPREMVLSLEMLGSCCQTWARKIREEHKCSCGTSPDCDTTPINGECCRCLGLDLGDGMCVACRDATLDGMREALEQDDQGMADYLDGAS